MLNKQKLITYCLVTSFVLFGKMTVAKAEEMPVAGINVVLNEYLSNNINGEADIIHYLPRADKIAFAQITNYANIRNVAGEEGEIIGKLYNNSAATILDQTDDWYKIKSGSVTGYIKKDFLVTGEKAEELAKELGTRIAVVTTTTLKVREEANQESSVLTLLPIGDELFVEEETGDWVKVLYDGDKAGYVSRDYVEVVTEYEEAVSIEEEQQRLEAEQAAEDAEQIRVAEQTAENAERVRLAEQAAEEAERAGLKESKEQKVTTFASLNQNSVRNNIVNYALKFLGNPYVWGGTSLTQGADCSGFTQSVFRDNGISIPRTSRSQAASGKRISISEMQPGDLIFYDKDDYINHVAIYIGNGKVISASSPKAGIRISTYNYRQPYRVVSYIDE